MKTNIQASINAKIFASVSDAKQAIADWKSDGQKIVFTNGVFDLLHIGHICYLAKAATEGDKIIIGLNTDYSVKLIKGNDRPINDQITRSLLLASMFFIDAVILFNEISPIEIIRGIKPDVLIKGADYMPENIVGADEVIANGGVVKTIELINGHSSSLLIDKIRKMT